MHDLKSSRIEDVGDIMWQRSQISPIQLLGTLRDSHFIDGGFLLSRRRTGKVSLGHRGRQLDAIESVVISDRRGRAGILLHPACFGTRGFLII